MNGKQLLSLYAEGLTWKGDGIKSYADFVGIGQNLIDAIVRAVEPRVGNLNFELGIDRPIPFLLIPPTPKTFSLQHEAIQFVHVHGCPLRIDCGNKPEARNLVAIPTGPYVLFDIRHQLRYKEEIVKVDEKSETKVRKLRPEKGSHTTDLEKSKSRDLTLYEVLWLGIFFPTLLDHVRIEAGGTEITIDWPLKKDAREAEGNAKDMIDDEPSDTPNNEPGFKGIRFSNEPNPDPTEGQNKQSFIAVVQKSGNGNPTIGRITADNDHLDRAWIPAVNSPSIRPFARTEVLSLKSS